MRQMTAKRKEEAESNSWPNSGNNEAKKRGHAAGEGGEGGGEEEEEGGEEAGCVENRLMSLPPSSLPL